MNSERIAPNGSTVAATTRAVAVLAFEGVELLDAVGPLEAFATASALLEGAAPRYRIDLLGRRNGAIRASSGLTILATQGIHTVGPLDTLLVAGGVGVEAAGRQAELVDWLRAVAGTVRRIGSVCTGALLLAGAGLLDGRRAVTHWNWCDRLAARHPAVRVERDPIFLRDGNIWTSAGVTAGIDLALAMIEEDHGRALALRTARELVMFLKRPGGQSQFSVQLAAQSTGSEPIRRLQEWALAHLAADLTVEALAERAAMSPRNFSRVFKRATNVTPADFVEQARLQEARQRLETTAASLDAIAADCGFRSADVMRRSFLRQIAVTPADYRQRFNARRRGATDPEEEEHHAESN